MAVSQIRASFQNDGNFSQLDLRDIRRKGPLLRIETFRCSQPIGRFGVTAAGTVVEAIAGHDHLASASNRIFRHIFSAGNPACPTATLEIRETYDENGQLEVRTRDIDGRSPSFGTVLISRATPVLGGINIMYEVREPGTASAVLINSPVQHPITVLADTLQDLSEPIEALGGLESVGDVGVFQAILSTNADNAAALRKLDGFAEGVRARYPRWTENVKVYERMGDFRDKCIHDGTNLVGEHAELASEYILIRAYRMSLITLGRIFDLAMSKGADRLNPDDPLAFDAKPGVYGAFLAAYALNIGLYQLGIDKVHSDYGGVPMKFRPGSRLENGAKPIVDGTNLNRMLALIAALYYVPAAVQQVVAIEPAINSVLVHEPAITFSQLVAA